MNDMFMWEKYCSLCQILYTNKTTLISFVCVYGDFAFMTL